jgi:hypothetical protein
MIQNSWSELEAEALEAYRFRLAGDPRSEWSIAEGKIDRCELLGIVQYYKFDAEKLPCCLCGRAIHHGGAVVQLRDFSFRLVGQCCGKAHFRQEWTTQTNAFRSAERAAEYRIRARRILAAEDDLVSACVSLRPLIDHQEAARRELKAAFGETFSELARELVRSSGRLSYGDVIGSTVNDQGGRASLKTIQRDTAGLSGLPMFSLLDKRKQLECAIAGLRMNLAQMRAALDEGRGLFPRLKKHGEIMDEIVALIADYNSSADYLSPHNAETLTFWFDKTGLQIVVDVDDNGWTVRSRAKRKLPTVAESMEERVLGRRAFDHLKCPPAIIEHQLSAA